MPGAKVKEILEHGVSAIEEGAGRFPQVSGIKFTYDPKAKAGNRIRDIFLSNEPLKSEKEYIVATNDFLVAGGDGYKAFSETLESSKDYTVIGGVIKAEKLVYSDASRYLRDIVVDYIKKKGILEPKTEGRIREVSEK